MLDPSEHAEDRNFIETILRYIPGFRGYLEKEYRRESDELQRDWLADQLTRSKRAIGDLSRPLADAGQIDILPEIDRLRGRLDKLIARIRGAMQGYSGFFDLGDCRLQRKNVQDRVLVEIAEQMPDVLAVGQDGGLRIRSGHCRSPHLVRPPWRRSCFSSCTKGANPGQPRLRAGAAFSPLRR